MHGGERKACYHYVCSTGETFLLGFSRKSEANASEFLENL